MEYPTTEDLLARAADLRVGPVQDLAVVVFYGLNDIELLAPDDDAYHLVIAVASGQADHQVTARGLAQWH